jgi:hypothetical protein
MDVLMQGIRWATRLVVGGLMIVMVVALWAAIALLRQPLAGVALGSGYSYVYITSFGTDCTSEPEPSLFFDCTFPLEGEPLYLRLKYTDPMRDYWTGCTATYRGATFRCQSSMDSPQFVLLDPEAVGISVERVARLRREHLIFNQNEAFWMHLVQGGAGALALVAGLHMVRRKVTPLSVVGGLTTAFFTYWLALFGLIIYFAMMQVLD